MCILQQKCFCRYFPWKRKFEGFKMKEVVVREEERCYLNTEERCLIRTAHPYYKLKTGTEKQ